jgi:hypothetical protein
MSEAQLLAAAIYQLRILLAPFGGPDADPDLRIAERLAYALHNHAWAVMSGKGFDCEAALAGVERMIGGIEGSEVATQLRSSISP